MALKKRYQKKKTHKKKINYKRMSKVEKPMISHSLISPSRAFTVLKYTDLKGPRVLSAGPLLGNIAIGAQTDSTGFSINGLFDPSDTLGSNGVNGFREWSQLYLRYRVHAVKVSFQFSNKNANPITMGLLFANTPSTGSGTWQTIMASVGNKYNVQRQLSGYPASPNMGKVSKYVTLADMSGGRLPYLASREYVGLTTNTGTAQAGSNPANPISMFAYICSQDPTTNFTADSPYVLNITWYVEFFDRPQILQP